MVPAHPVAMHRYPWGPMQVLIGVGLGVLAYAVILVAVAVTASLMDRGTSLDDPIVARTTYLIGLGLYVLLGLAVVVATRHSPASLWRIFAIRKFDVMVEWMPMGLAVLAYLGVIAYAILVQVLDISLLKPENIVPEGVKVDDIAFYLFGAVAVIGAPIGEELFFRGLIFAGLLRWGFWPAALISGAFFSLAHASVGTLIPFTAVGVLLAWIFYWRGSLIDSIIAHATFNSVSFAILAATR
jgi:uncharacterized protein